MAGFRQQLIMKKPKQSASSRLCLASQNTHFRHKSCNLSVSQSLETSSVWWTGTHVVNLCLWSGRRTASDQMHTSMLRKDEGEKPANVAFCFAIFPSCSRPVGTLPAGGETVETQASAAPLSPCKSLHHLHPTHREAQKWKQKPVWGLVGLRLATEFQVSATKRWKITELLYFRNTKTESKERVKL